MTTEAFVLIGHGAGHVQDVIDRHADRLDRRGVAGDVHAVVYEHEPVRELREELGTIDADRVYVMPAFASHTHDTIEDLPRALSSVPGEIHYCEPLGRSPAVTDVLLDRASEELPGSEDVSFVLVGFGSGSKPYGRQTAEYHAARIEEHATYGEVRTCYLLQNPAVECVRYTVSKERAVAVPLFFARNAATEAEIPRKLEVDRGGLAYADPLGTHPRITEAIHAELEEQRVLARSKDSSPFEAQSVKRARPVATDGEGGGGRR